ncbi:MAG: hypothetical protein A2Y62_13750 [Candidatus Fischerbacteria bacterium RBG_13_37_8]|uniref:Uncharacterized protein n=1 Tax=Candidatus Fischerbacteria bacterium RBG_13_37_8 TaxID=1817863 RepID=A0A1F5V7D9_9BACT|nr:MAG: hypothetical protein A2Y62_13750 [Candidatus Fischerbacteria bacterium RBG_13_37_8]
MKVSAVTRYKEPRYPDRALYALQPKLLASMIPPQWLKSKAVMGTLIAFVLSGAKIDFAIDQVTEPIQATSPENAKKENEPKQEQAEMKIAPLFMHGEGRGATGCVVISAPVFLSEAEAIEIIFDELKKNDIPFDKRNVSVPDFSIEEKRMDYYSRPVETFSLKHPFAFDGFSTKYNLGFKFVSQLNYYLLGGDHSFSTVQDYDFIKVAFELKEKIRDTHRANTVIFYDPVVSESDCGGQTKNADLLPPSPPISDGAGKFKYHCKDYAKQLLKQQVQDFISWLTSEFASMDPKQ